VATPPSLRPEDDHTADPVARMPAPVRWGAGLVEILGGMALLVLMGLTVSDALLRSLANRPILGASDLIQVLLALVVAASLPLCVLAGRAIAIESLLRALPRGLSGIVARLAHLIAAAALAVLAWRAWINAGEAAMFGETTMLRQIPYGPFYAALALSAALSAAIFLAFALRRQSVT
jgi:TRAP-type C4-dicarboxylate transport system permease small subunit